jgi:hypothetical protein
MPRLAGVESAALQSNGGPSTPLKFIAGLLVQRRHVSRSMTMLPLGLALIVLLLLLLLLQLLL